MNTSDDIVKKLRSRFRTLGAQRAQLLGTAEAVQKDMVRIRKAYNALVGKVLTDTPSKPVVAVRLSAKTRTLDGDQVHSALIEFLSVKTHTEDQLRQKLNSLAIKKGVGRRGLHLVLGRVLKSPEFLAAGDLWLLKQNANPGPAQVNTG